MGPKARLLMGAVVSGTAFPERFARQRQPQDLAHIVRFPGPVAHLTEQHQTFLEPSGSLCGVTLHQRQSGQAIQIVRLIFAITQRSIPFQGAFVMLPSDRIFAPIAGRAAQTVQGPRLLRLVANLAKDFDGLLVAVHRRRKVTLREGEAGEAVEIAHLSGPITGRVAAVDRLEKPRPCQRIVLGIAGRRAIRLRRVPEERSAVSRAAATFEHREQSGREPRLPGIASGRPGEGRAAPPRKLTYSRSR